MKSKLFNALCLPTDHYSGYTGYGLWAMGYALLNAGVINTRTHSVRAKGQNKRFELLTAVLLKTQVC